MDLDLLKLLGQFGVAGVALAVLGKIVWIIGLRIVASIDRTGSKADGAAQRIEDKLNEHTKTDVAAWADVGMRIETHLNDARSDIAELRQEVSEDVATLRRDVAVLGTRVDVAIGQHSDSPHATPRAIDEEHSRRMSIPRQTRYDSVPQSGTPVVDRPPIKRPTKGQKDD